MSKIPEIKIDTWSKFLEFIDKNQFICREENECPINTVLDPKEFKGYFRGVGNADYNLSSTLERYILNAMGKDFSYQLDKRFFEKICLNYLEKCKEKLKGYFPEQVLLLNKEHENEIWYWGQHYGLPTPYLDWSKSFFVALYFAFENQLENSEYRAIYHLGSLFLKNKIDIIESKLDIGGRLSAQKGVFTRMLSYELENINPEKTDKNISENIEQMHLRKILISSNLRGSIRQFLLSINIDGATIYPDIKGAINNSCFELDDLINIYSCGD